MNKAFLLVPDATGRTAEVCAVDLRHPIPPMTDAVLGWH